MPKFAANLTMLYNEVEFLDRFGAASRAGFKGVEYLFPYPYPKEQLAETLERQSWFRFFTTCRRVTGPPGNAASPCCPSASESFRTAWARRSTTPPRSAASR